jgi:hypothetical protein
LVWAVPGFFTCCASSSTKRLHSRHDAVRRQHYIVLDGACGERGVAGVPVAAVVRHHPQLGREPIQLALPVAQHRHRTHDQRRSVRRAGQDRCDQLGGLAEPHVVGQAGTEPQLAEHPQPADAPLLIGTELAHEAHGVHDRLNARFAGAVEQVTQPTRGTHAVHRQVFGNVEAGHAEAGAHEVGGPGAAAGSHVAHDGIELGRIDLDPLAPQPDQRLLGRGRALQDGQLLSGQRVATQRRLPREVHELVEPQPGRDDGAARALFAGRRLGSQGHTATTCPPARQQDGDARLVERPQAQVGEAQQVGRRKRHAPRTLLVEDAGELGGEPRQTAETEQDLLDRPRLLEVGPRSGGERRRSGPHLGERNDDARLVSVLHDQLDRPALFDGLQRGRIGPIGFGRDGIRFGGLADANAESGPAGRHCARANPRVDRCGQRDERGVRDSRGVRGEPGIDRRQRGDPFVDRVRTGTASEPQSGLAREPMPDQRVNRFTQLCGQSPMRLAPGVAVLGQHRGEELAIVGRGQRPPPGPGPPIGLDREPGHHPTRGHEVTGKCVDLGRADRFLGEHRVTLRPIERAHVAVGAGCPSTPQDAFRSGRWVHDRFHPREST